MEEGAKSFLMLLTVTIGIQDCGLRTNIYLIAVCQQLDCDTGEEGSLLTGAPTWKIRVRMNSKMSTQQGLRKRHLDCSLA